MDSSGSENPSTCRWFSCPSSSRPDFSSLAIAEKTEGKQTDHPFVSFPLPTLRAFHLPKIPLTSGFPHIYTGRTNERTRRTDFLEVFGFFLSFRNQSFLILTHAWLLRLVSLLGLWRRSFLSSQTSSASKVSCNRRLQTLHRQRHRHRETTQNRHHRLLSRSKPMVMMVVVVRIAPLRATSITVNVMQMRM